MTSYFLCHFPLFWEAVKTNYIFFCHFIGHASSLDSTLHFYLLVIPCLPTPRNEDILSSDALVRPQRKLMMVKDNVTVKIKLDDVKGLSSKLPLCITFTTKLYSRL